MLHPPRPYLLFHIQRHHCTSDLWHTKLYILLATSEVNFLSRSHCIIRFEMLDAAKNKLRVKVSYVMIALTVLGCIYMVYEGKQVRVDFLSLFVSHKGPVLTPVFILLRRGCFYTKNDKKQRYSSAKPRIIPADKQQMLTLARGRTRLVFCQVKRIHQSPDVINNVKKEISHWQI